MTCQSLLGSNAHALLKNQFALAVARLLLKSQQADPIPKYEQDRHYPMIG